MPGGRSHHGASHLGAARKEDAVKSFAQQRLGDIALARHDGDIFLGKGRPDKLDNCSGGVRRELRRFEHRAVARRQRADQRRDQKLERIVPRPHDERHTIRFGLDKPVRGPREQRSPASLWSHPRRQTAESVTDLAQHEAEFGGVGIIR